MTAPSDRSAGDPRGATQAANDGSRPTPQDGEPTACQRWAALVDREAIGDALGADEERFVREHAAACSQCAAEASAYGALAELADDRGAAGDHAGAIDDLLRAARAPAPREAERSSPAAATSSSIVTGQRDAGVDAPAPRAREPAVARPLLARVARPTAVAALALAAAFALWATFRGAAQASARVQVASGETRVDGAPAVVGRELPTGALLTADVGPLCLRIDPGVTACLAPGSRAVLVDRTPAHRRLRLEAGHIAVSLPPQPAGTTFGVVTDAGEAVAIGTEFAVEVPGVVPTDEPMLARVTHGEIAVRPAGAAETRLRGGEAMQLRGGARRPMQDAERASDALLLAPGLLEAGGGGTIELMAGPQDARISVNGTPVGFAPVAMRVPAGACSVEVVPVDGGPVQRDRFDVAAGAEVRRDYTVDEALPAPAPAVPPQAPSASPTAPPSGSASAPVASPAEMLKHARELRAQGRFKDAAAEYRKLQSAHPRSAEARAALVSLGDLSLSQLGDAAGALRSFDAYLAGGGGGLAQEAQHGRIRALRALGRSGDERAAIEAFLASWPKSVHAASLEERLRALGGGH